MNRKRFFLTSVAILIALVVGAALNSTFRLPSVQAQAPLTIPKSYGTLKAALAGNLIFEDSMGTIRVVSISGGSLGQVIEFRRN